MLKEITEFFQARRSVVLVDLDVIEISPEKDQEEVKSKATPTPKKDNKLEPVPVKKELPKYVESDASYVHPPSSISPDA